MAKPTTGARLRKTFHYPSDDDDDNPSSQVLDEQGAPTAPPPDLRSLLETNKSQLTTAKQIKKPS